MFKKFTLLAGGIVALYTLDACVVVGAAGSGGSAGNGTGGDTVSTSSTGGAGGTGGAGTAGSGTGGKGGGGTCDHCADYVTKAAAGDTPNPICADDPASGTTSATLLKALNDCTCDDAAGCGASCKPSKFCTMGGTDPSAECSKCVQQGACGAAFGACAGDIGNP